MKKMYLILFVIALIVLQITAVSNSDFTNRIIDICALVCILFAGIPHGAVDHVIDSELFKHSRLKFYSIYLGLFVLVIVAWIFFSTASFLLFLVVSALHFGDTHYSVTKMGDRITFLLLKSTWGITVVLALFYHSFNRLNLTILGAKELDDLMNTIGQRNLLIVFLASAGSYFALLIYSLLKKQLNTDKFKSEIFLIAVINLLFLLLPPLTAFALFFLCIHTSESMQIEYNYLRNKGTIDNKRQFLVLLLPFSIISIAGIVICFSLIHYFTIEIAVFHFAFAAIAALTLPHALIMAALVKKVSRENIT